MTLAGLSRVNVENALAVTSAALALGLQPRAGRRRACGRSTPGADNPGRMNIWTLPVADAHADGQEAEISVVIDLAHNEAGLQALLEIMPGIQPPGGRLLLGVGTAGDRSDDVFVRPWGRSLRWRPTWSRSRTRTSTCGGVRSSELGALIKEGAEHAGVTIAREHPGEVAALASLVAQARPGDVIALMTHQDRAQVDAWLVEHGGRRDAVADLRTKVRRAGG